MRSEGVENASIRAFKEKFVMASTAEDTARQGQQGRRRCSPVCESLVLGVQGAQACRNFPCILPD